jgi:tRNA (Thr-GGU) A37 N-methylase
MRLHPAPAPTAAIAIATVQVGHHGSAPSSSAPLLSIRHENRAKLEAQGVRPLPSPVRPGPIGLATCQANESMQERAIQT